MDFFRFGFVRRHGLAVGAVALIAVGGGFGTAVLASTPASPSTTTSSTSSLALESWSQCTPSLCIDAPPEGKGGLDGSGGWGYGTNSPVRTLTVGMPATLTVTALQPNPASTPGTITLTYSSHDFTLNTTDSRGVTGTNPFDRGGVLVFQEDANYFSHNDSSVGFTFTPVHPTTNFTDVALVTATVDVGGQQASETFPVSITN